MVQIHPPLILCFYLDGIFINLKFLYEGLVVMEVSGYVKQNKELIKVGFELR